MEEKRLSLSHIEDEYAIDEVYIVKGEHYTVKFVEGLKDEHGRSCYGICDDCDYEILIEKSLSADKKLETLYHELGHALLAEIGLHETDLDDNIEELIVQGYAKFLFRNFRLLKRIYFNKITL